MIEHSRNHRLSSVTMEVEEKSRDYDDFLEEHAGFSWFQIFLCAGAFWLAFSTSAVSQIAIFLSGVPDFRYGANIYEELKRKNI